MSLQLGTALGTAFVKFNGPETAVFSRASCWIFLICIVSTLVTNFALSPLGDDFFLGRKSRNGSCGLESWEMTKFGREKLGRPKFGLANIEMPKVCLKSLDMSLRLDPGSCYTCWCWIQSYILYTWVSDKQPITSLNSLVCSLMMPWS